MKMGFQGGRRGGRDWLVKCSHEVEKDEDNTELSNMVT